MSHRAMISIVIPTHNSTETLLETLTSISDQTVAPLEIIVVDDGSQTPVSKDLGIESASFLRIPESRGPAAARNLGAESAQGDVILFVDADVILFPDVVQRIQNHFHHHPDLAAVQGIYSVDIPSNRTIFSRYQNHYYHFTFRSIQTESPALCATFCFAIRRSVFCEMGGFDSDIQRPTVEDEVFGYTLARAGHPIVLDKELMVTHLAEYSLDSLILRKFRMSFHQIKSLLRGNKPPLRASNSANQTHHPFDTLAGILLAPILPLTLLSAWPALIFTVFLYCAANARFWSYLFRQEPPIFTFEMILLTWIDQITIFCGLTAGSIDFLLLKNRW